MIINKNVTEGMKINDTKTPKFYLRLKMDKECNPGRPVTGSLNCHSAYISKQDIQDMQDFLKKLEKVKDITKEGLLATLDVKSRSHEVTKA